MAASSQHADKEKVQHHDKDKAQESRDKALEAAIAQIDKQFGKGAIMQLGEMANMEVDSIPTGSIALDLALGIGGVPRGRIIEIYGPESSGKTTLAQHILAEAQRMGGVVAYVDAEHALDPGYAAKCGINVDEMLISQPDTGEQALEIVDVLVRSGAVDAIVIDSVAALVPRAEIEGDMGDSHVGLQARLMSQALRKLTAAISRSNSMVIFINQLREKIGVMFGNPETTTGGKALKFYASVRLDIRRIDQIKQGNEVVGGRVKVKVVKNKVAPPFRDGRVRPDVRRGHLQGGRPAGCGPGDGHGQEERRLLLLRRAAAGPGARERQGVPAAEPRRARRDRRADPCRRRRFPGTAADRRGGDRRSGLSAAARPSTGA